MRHLRLEWDWNGLRRDLQKWSDDWSDTWQPSTRRVDDSQASAAQLNDHEEQAQRLLLRLREELGDGYQVDSGGA